MDLKQEDIEMKARIETEARKLIVTNSKSLLDSVLELAVQMKKAENTFETRN